VGAAACYWQAGKSLVVFGGRAGPTHFSDLFLLDLQTLHWTQPAIKSTGPSPRHSPAIFLQGTGAPPPLPPTFLVQRGRSLEIF